MFCFACQLFFVYIISLQRCYKSVSVCYLFRYYMVQQTGINVTAVLLYSCLSHVSYNPMHPLQGMSFVCSCDEKPTLYILLNRFLVHSCTEGDLVQLVLFMFCIGLFMYSCSLRYLVQMVRWASCVADQRIVLYRWSLWCPVQRA